MNARPIHTRVTLLGEPRPFKPRGVAVAAAIGREPLLSDLDAMPPPRGAMLPFPPAPGVVAECVARARRALAMGGTVALFVATHEAAAAERWLSNLDAEGRQ